MTQAPPPPVDRSKLTPGQLVELLSSVPIIQCLHVVARLGVADLVKDGPRTIDELAAETKAHAPTLLRVLRTLACRGVFELLPDGRLGPSPASRMLEAKRMGTARDIAVMVGEPLYWEPTGALLHAVMTGESAFTHVHGAPLYDYLEAHPDASRAFFASLAPGAKLQDQAILKHYDFSGFTTVLDIGGGDGSFLIQLMEKFPTLKTVLFDLPQVVKLATEIERRPELRARCDIKTGSFFERVPSGADGYVLRGVPMDWDDARLATILHNVRAAMAPGSKLLTALTLDADAPRERMLDLNLLMMAPAGRLRSQAELHAAYAAAGLDITRVIQPPYAERALVEAVPV